VLRCLSFTRHSRQESLLELTVDTPLRAPLSPTLSATAACAAAEGDAALRLTRLSLVAAPTSRTRLRLALRGASAADAAPTLNPAHGRALSALGREGSVLYRRLRGGAACAASTDVPTPAGALTLSLVAFVTPRRSAHRSDAGDSDNEGGGSSSSSSRSGAAASDGDAAALGHRLTALAQATLRPAPRVALALTATRSALTPWPRRWSSGSSNGDADAAAAALAAQAAQALAHADDDALVPAARTCVASMVQQQHSADVERGAAAGADVTTSVGAAFAAVVHDTVTATLWAAADVGRGGTRAGGVEWAAALAPAPHAAGLRWGLVAGRPLASGAAQAEAFLHCGGTGGWTVTPGMLAVRGAGVAALLRAHASF
jgi:hypothetical protein